MTPKFKKLARRSFIFFNILSVLLYLLVCLVPFLDAGEFWFVAVWGLVFPLLFIIVVIFLVGWTILRSRWAFLSLAALLLSWQQLSVVVGLRSEKDFSITKEEGTLRVLSWNVSRWDEGNKKMRGGTSFRNLMHDLVQTQYADVLCFQEFFESYNLQRFEANIPVFEKMGYPYHIFSPKIKNPAKVYQIGLCIFSRYPIIDSAALVTSLQENWEGTCHIDIQFQNQPIRILTTHLESVGFGRQDYEGFGTVNGPGSKLSKLKWAYGLRSTQADMVNKEVKASPYPVVLCGDMNDVPNSYTYFTVRGSLQDAFLKKGSGLGRTFRFISPTLRIDYIFADKRFRVKQYGRVKVNYSDHYPVIADLQLVEKQ